MNLSQIQIFSAIAEHLSFTKAATQLKMDKSTVSSKLSQLEKQLDIRLLNRSTRSVTLTEAGAGLYDYCKSIIDIAKEAERFTATLRDKPAGLLRITMSSSFTNLIINEVIKPFTKENPEINFDIELNTNNQNLIKNNFDVALRLNFNKSGLQDSTLIAKKLMTFETGIFCSPHYLEKNGGIKSLNNLRHLDFIDFSNSYSSKIICEKLHKEIENFNMKSRIRSDDYNFCKEAAIAGLGIILSTKQTIKKELDSKQLVAVLGETVFSKAELYAVYPSKTNTPKKLKLFLDYLLLNFNKQKNI